MASKDLSVYEYTLKNYAFTALGPNAARFVFSNRVSEAAPDPGESSTVGQGSGPNPVYHTETVREPKFSLTVPVDEATRFFKWLKKNCIGEVCDLESRRGKPGVAPVSDLKKNWKPLKGAQTIGTDANMVPISGNVLGEQDDITNVLQP